MDDKPYFWLVFPCCDKTFAVEKPDFTGIGEYECPACGTIVTIDINKKEVKP